MRDPGDMDGRSRVTDRLPSDLRPVRYSLRDRELSGTGSLSADDSVRTSLWVEADGLERALSLRLDAPARPIAFRPVVDWSAGLAASLLGLAAKLLTDNLWHVRARTVFVSARGESGPPVYRAHGGFVGQYTNHGVAQDKALNSRPLPSSP